MRNILVGIGAAVLGAIVVIEYWGMRSDEVFDYYYDTECLIDYAIEQGLAPQNVEQREALLSQRKIVTTIGVNVISSQEIMSSLLRLNGEDPQAPIDLYLTTLGGWEIDAFAIIDVMCSLEAPVNVHAVGESHSAGLMLLAAGTGERIVHPYTILGFHTAADDEDEIYLHRYQNFWREKAKLPESWIERLDDEMLYFTAEQAIEYAVADRIALSSAPPQR